MSDSFFSTLASMMTIGALIGSLVIGSFWPMIITAIALYFIGIVSSQLDRNE